MDSGRLALLEKAREFGSLAQNMTFQDFLNKSVTYRTLALYLGVETQWWSEFWRSFSFAVEKDANQKLHEIRSFCKINDLQFLLMFLCCWFGKDTPISEISEKEFDQVFHLAMRT